MGKLLLDMYHKANGAAVSGPVTQRERDSFSLTCTSKETGQLFLDLYPRENGTAVSGHVAQSLHDNFACCFLSSDSIISFHRTCTTKVTG